MVAKIIAYGGLVLFFVGLVAVLSYLVWGAGLMHTMTLYTVIPGGAVWCCATCGFSVAYWHRPFARFVMDAGAAGIGHAAAGRLLWEAGR